MRQRKVTPEETARLFAGFPAFASIGGGEARTFVERTMLRRLPAGETYLRDGDSCSAIALVLEGRLRVSKSAPSGREITLYQIVPGETCILTASCLLAGKRYPAQADVVEDVEAALVPADVFRRAFDSVPDVRMFVFDHFTERLATTMALVEEVAFRRVDQRAARWLAEQSGDAQVLAMSHEEIAAHLGTARVVVSRVLENFGSRGWVKLGRRKVEVLDPKALRAFGSQSD
ncbi:MAG: Crp/Fnr family transcriptional regulator [Gemmatimonadaceae bacterium]